MRGYPYRAEVAACGRVFEIDVGFEVVLYAGVGLDSFSQDVYDCEFGDLCRV